MINRVCLRVFSCLIGMAACLLPAADGQAQGCRLTLKNGNVVSAPHCYEENGVVYLSKLGGYLGLKKIDVAKIEKIKEEETVDASVDVPEAPSTEREGKSKDDRGGTAAERRERKKAEQTERKREEKTKAAAREAEERPYKEFKSQEEVLRLARIDEAIQCGRALEPITPTSGPISGEAAAAKMKTGHDASQGCRYYKTRIPQMEKKLEELRSRCGSQCR